MNDNLLRMHNQILADHRFKSTLILTSVRKDDDVDSTSSDKYVFPSQYDKSSLACLDFDEIKKSLYPRACSSSGNVPCSVDALTFERSGSYLIEFKFDNASAENLLRKVYDSIMLLIEHDEYTFERARNELVYLVVSTGIEDRVNGKKRVLGRSYSYCKNPWSKFHKSDDRWKLAALKGVIVKEVYSMHPATFNYFARLNHWQ